MKARVKATGEIVDVLPYADEDGTVRFYANMENEWHEAYEIDIVSEVTQPDYWEKLKHQYAGMALQGLLSNSAYLENYVKYSVVGESLTIVVTANAIDYATALVNRLKEDSQCEK